MKDRKNFIKLIAAFAAVYIIWGSTYLGIRFAIETLPPFLMAGTRFLLAGGILFLFARYKSPSPIEFIHWKSSLIIGGFLLLGGNGGVVWAEQFVPSGLTAILVATVPIWVVLISWLRKGVKPTFQIIVGVLLGFAGLIFLVNPFNFNGNSINFYGVTAILIASLSWAFGSVYTKHAVLPKSKLIAVAMQMLCGGILLTIAGLLTGEGNEINFEGISAKSLLAVLYLIIFGSIVAFTSYIWLIEAAGPSKAATYAYVNPVVAVFLGWIFASEVISLRIIIAAAVIILSVAIINSSFSILRNFSLRRSSIPNEVLEKNQ